MTGLLWSRYPGGLPWLAEKFLVELYVGGLP